MNRIFTYVGAIALLTQAASQWNYPATRTVEASDTYFGKTYKDPYRWLEDLKDKDVEAWFKAQAALTDDLLARIPARDALANEWMELDKLKPASFSAITYKSGRVFYKKTLGGENVGKLYYRDGWKGAEHLLFDPSSVSPKGAKAGDVATIVSYRAVARWPACRARALGGGRGVLRAAPARREHAQAASREHLPVVRPAQLDDGQQVVLVRRRQGDRYQERGDRAEPEDASPSARR